MYSGIPKLTPASGARQVHTCGMTLLNQTWILPIRTRLPTRPSAACLQSPLRLFPPLTPPHSTVSHRTLAHSTPTSSHPFPPSDIPPTPLPRFPSRPPPPPFFLLPPHPFPLFLPAPPPPSPNSTRPNSRFNCLQQKPGCHTAAEFSTTEKVKILSNVGYVLFRARDQ